MPSVPRTSISNVVQEALFPQPSVATQVTWVIPTLNAIPESVFGTDNVPVVPVRFAVRVNVPPHAAVAVASQLLPACTYVLLIGSVISTGANGPVGQEVRVGATPVILYV